MSEDLKAKKEAIETTSNFEYDITYEHAPLNKSEETKLFENIVTDIIHDMKLQLVDEQIFDKRAELYKKENELYVKHNNKEINLNKLMKDVNLKHIKIPHSALDEYETLYDTAKIIDNEFDAVVDKKDFEDRINKLDDVKQRVNLQKLSYAERSAINSYTGKAYKSINDFLRGVDVPERPDRIIIDLAVASTRIE